MRLNFFFNLHNSYVLFKYVYRLLYFELLSNEVATKTTVQHCVVGNGQN